MAKGGHEFPTNGGIEPPGDLGGNELRLPEHLDQPRVLRQEIEKGVVGGPELGGGIRLAADGVPQAGNKPLLKTLHKPHVDVLLAGEVEVERPLG